MLDAAIRPVRKAADEKSVAIMCGMMIENEVRLDPAKMTQVFVNLLSNAIKFTPEGGSIEVDSEPDAGRRRSRSWCATPARASRPTISVGCWSRSARPRTT